MFSTRPNSQTKATDMTTKAELQEEALQLEVPIYYPEGHENEGKELTNEDLVEAVADQKAEDTANHEADEKDKQAARDADKPGENPPVPKPWRTWIGPRSSS